jgi:Bacterial Ig-like domain (group 1)
VTATVTDAFGNPVPGVTVRFSVPTAVATFASPSSGSDVTDASGEATFCYSASLPGVDAIHAFADTNNDGGQDPGEPFGDATKTWTVPPSTELCEVKITEGGWMVANNGDRASFGGNAKVDADGNVQGQQEYQDHGPAQPRNAHSIELLATTCSDDLTSATIFGTATINGSGEYVFRIDVIDMGQPGTSDSYGIMLSDGYASGQKQLQGGNVTIHK